MRKFIFIIIYLIGLVILSELIEYFLNHASRFILITDWLFSVLIGAMWCALVMKMYERKK